LDLADSRDHRGKLVRLEVPVSQEALARVVSRVYSVIPDFQDLPDFQDSPVPLEIKDNKVILEHRAWLDFQETKVTNVFGCWFRFGCLLFSQEVDTNLWPVCAFYLCLCMCDDILFLGGTGATGARGTPGATGFSGPRGGVGPSGNVGSPGQQGSQGQRGDTGASGDVGQLGVAGFTGQRGPQGQSGPVGVPGPVGFTGLPGDIGNPGSGGIAGATGATGAPGFQGAVGATGSKGTWNKPIQTLPHPAVFLNSCCAILLNLLE